MECGRGKWRRGVGKGGTEGGGGQIRAVHKNLGRDSFNDGGPPSEASFNELLIPCLVVQWEIIYLGF